MTKCNICEERGTGYTCPYGYKHDYSKIQPPDESDYHTFGSWDEAKSWLAIAWSEADDVKGENNGKNH